MALRSKCHDTIALLLSYTPSEDVDKILSTHHAMVRIIVMLLINYAYNNKVTTGVNTDRIQMTKR